MEEKLLVMGDMVVNTMNSINKKKCTIETHDGVGCDCMKYRGFTND